MKGARQCVRDRRVVAAIAAAGATLVLAPPAHGDDMPGLAMFILTFWLSVEIGITIAEAQVYHLVLGLRRWRALGTSIVANLASIVAGRLLVTYVYGYLPIPRNHIATILLGGTITVIVEPPIVAWLNLRYPNIRRLYMVAIVTNICSYTAGTAILYWLL